MLALWGKGGEGGRVAAGFRWNEERLSGLLASAYDTDIRSIPKGPPVTELPVNTLIRGHAAEVMRTWPDQSVDLIVTSPPYWNAVEYDG